MPRLSISNPLKLSITKAIAPQAPSDESPRLPNSGDLAGDDAC